MNSELFRLTKFVQGQDILGISRCETASLLIGLGQLLKKHCAVGITGRVLDELFRCKFIIHPADAGFWQGNGKKFKCNLLGNLLLANERLRTEASLFGAAEIVVPFLCFDRDDPAALAAAKDLAIEIRLKLAGMVPPLAANDFLDAIKQGFANKRLMLAIIKFPAMHKGAIVDRIAEQAVQLSA